MYQNAVLLLQVCPQRREANVPFPSIAASRPVAIVGMGLQLGGLQSFNVISMIAVTGLSLMKTLV